MNGTACYVLTDPGVPAFGAKGCSVHVQEVLRQLRTRYAAVHLVAVTPGGPPPADLAGVVVHRVTWMGGARPAGPAEREAAQRAADIAAAATVDRICASTPVAVVWQRYALWSAAPLVTAAGHGACALLEMNAPLPDEAAAHRGLTDHAGALDWTRRALAAADVPFAVAGPVARWAADLDPHGRQVPVVPNGVDTERFVPGPGSGGPGLTVAFAGGFRPWHGTGLLVDAVADARAKGADLRLLLLGDGPAHAAALVAADDAGVPVTAPGRVDPADVPAWLQRADLAAAPYPAGEHYFSPLKVAEYLAAGLPTVASAIADLPGLLADGTEALLVPAGDRAATADALHRLGTDPELRTRMAAAARRAAIERMTWSASVDAVLDRCPERVA